MSDKGHKLNAVLERIKASGARTDEELAPFRRELEAIQNEGKGFLGSIGLSGVQGFVDDISGASATREASAALQEGNRQAVLGQDDERIRQGEFLQQQRDIFDQSQTSTQNRLDQLINESRQQFQQRQQGVQDRFNQSLDISQRQFQQRQEGIQGRFDQVQGNLQPFLDAGSRSIASIEELVANPGLIKDSPAFQFRLKQGLEAAQNSAAARGQGLGGNVLRSLQRVGQGEASAEIQNEFNRRATLFQGGQNTIDQLIQASGQTGQLEGGAFNQLGGATDRAFNQFGGGASGAFDRFGAATSGALGNAGNQSTANFGNLSGAVGGASNASASISNNIANLANQSGKIEASSILGQRQNQVDAALGAIKIGTSLYTGLPSLSLGGESRLPEIVGAVGSTEPTLPGFIPR